MSKINAYHNKVNGTKKRSETPERRINLSANSQRLKDEVNQPQVQVDHEASNNESLIMEDSTPLPNLKYSELLFNVNDDFKTLISKNTKLRSLLIEANNKLNELSTELDRQKTLSSKEKLSLLSQLDKITSNYSLYAESHKNLLTITEDLDRMKIDFEKCQTNENKYREMIKKILEDSLVTFKKLYIYGKNNKIKPEDPIFEYFNVLKTEMLDNFKAYKDSLDLVNFKKTHDEILNILVNSQYLNSNPSLKPKVSEHSITRFIDGEETPNKRDYNVREKPLTHSKSPLKSTKKPSDTITRNKKLSENESKSSEDNTNAKAKANANVALKSTIIEKSHGYIADNYRLQQKTGDIVLKKGTHVEVLSVDQENNLCLILYNEKNVILPSSYVHFT